MDTRADEDPGVLVQALVTDATDGASVSLLNQLQAHSTTPDIEATSRICSLLLDDGPALDAFVRHTSPKAIVQPIAALIDRPELGSPTEEPAVVGQILTFAQVLIQRALQQGDHIDDILPRQQYTTLPAYVRASTRTMPLADFSAEHRELIDNWITALFGSDGISDDLIRTSSPLLVLRITPTLFAQAIAASLANVVDAEALRSGLTYYLQDLLSYALPAALRWLVEEIARCNATEEGQHIKGVGDTDPALVARTARMRSTCLDVLSSLLSADSCPGPARQLLAGDVVAVLQSCRADVFTEASANLVPLMRQQLEKQQLHRGMALEA